MKPQLLIRPQSRLFWGPQLSNATPFCENYTKLYFDAKHLEKELNRG